MHRPKQLDRPGDGGLARRLVSHVGLDHLRDAAFLVDHALGLVGPRDVEVEECHLGAVASQENSGGPAVANFACNRGKELGILLLLVELGNEQLVL